MNLAFSAFVLQGGRTGVASHVTNLLAALQAAPHEHTMDVLVPEPDQALLPITDPRFRKSVIAKRWAPPIPAILWHNLVLPGRARREKYDLVHIPSYRRIPWRQGAPLVATVHDLATLHMDGKYDAARMFYNRRIVPSLIRRADHVITVSRFTRDDLITLVGYPADRITVIYQGINHAVYQPLPVADCRARLREKYGLDKPFIVFVSRVEHPAKNHVRLIEAFERLKLSRKLDVQLVMAGADWNGADVVKQRAARSPVAADIRFTGFVPLAEIPMLYSACEMMVYPSLFEGFGFPIIEALACGAHVACSNTTSMREIAGPCVPTFDPLNIEEMAQRIAAMLERGRDPALSAAGSAYAAGFQWADTARQTIAVYERVNQGA